MLIELFIKFIQKILAHSNYPAKVLSFTESIKTTMENDEVKILRDIILSI